MSICGHTSIDIGNYCFFKSDVSHIVDLRHDRKTKNNKLYRRMSICGHTTIDIGNYFFLKAT